MTEKMKRILSIILLMSSLLLDSCMREDLDILYPSGEGEAEFSLSVKVPLMSAGTKALGETPDIASLHLAVFDDAGYLAEYVKAEADLASQNAVRYAYSVALSLSDAPRIIHFIANGPESVDFGSETAVVAELMTSGGKDAYWQRIVLPDGITTDGNGKPSAQTEAALTGVPLIRNFARVRLSESADDFSLRSFALVNVPDAGSVAPYNTVAGGFCDYLGKSHEALVAEGYQSFVPSGAALKADIPQEGDFTDASQYIYTYEREMPVNNPAYLIVYGDYSDGSVTRSGYYKVDLRLEDGQYFPLLRNFQYNVNITEVNRFGSATPQEAAFGAGSGDVSTSIETEGFLNISDGAARIFVSFTDTTLVDDSPVVLKYKFISDLENQTISNDDVSLTIMDDAVYGPVIGSAAIGTADDAEGWRSVVITPEAVREWVKTQSLVLRGTTALGGKTVSLQRKVYFTLRDRLVMNVYCDPDAVIKEPGEKTDLVIGVPGGLGSAMFPMDFQIEAAKLSLTPDNDQLPVETGGSIIPGRADKASFHFVKSLSWEEYQEASLSGGYRYVRCHFMTNKAESATDIYVVNKYFDTASAYLDNYEPSEFTMLAYNAVKVMSGVGVDVDFSFRISNIPVMGNIVVTLDGLEPADDSQLKFLGVLSDGRAQYEYSPGTVGTHVLHLKTIVEDADLDVALSAYRFLPASLSISRGRSAFSNLVFAGDVPVGYGKTATFNFSYDVNSVVPVSMTLTGLKPSAADTRFTELGEGVYRFVPSNTSQIQSIVFETVSFGESVGVSLAATGYDPASLSTDRTLSVTLTCNGLNLGGFTRNRTVTVYSSSSMNQQLATFTTSGTSSVTIRGTFSETQTLYFRYTYWGTAYTASASMASLADGSQTITFSR